ncbi:MAG: hypothetical protein WAW88_15645, partial [Nocardioides sp.]
MRSFPRAGRRRVALSGAYAATLGLLVTLLLGILVPLSLSTPANGTDRLGDRRHEVRDELAQAEDDLEGSTQRAREAVTALRDAESRLDAARTRLGV